MAKKPKPCICENIPGWKTIVDIDNKPLTCYAGVSIETELIPLGMPLASGQVGTPRKIIPDAKCPACKKNTYKCQKCTDEWGWNFGSSTTFGRSVSTCKWPNGETKAPIIMGWYRKGDCAHAIFSCGQIYQQPYYINSGQWTYNDGRKYSTSDNTSMLYKPYSGISGEVFKNFENSSYSSIKDFGVPVVKFRSRNIEFRRPSVRLGIPSSLVETYKARDAFECRAILCDVSSSISNSPCHPDCNKPNAPRSPTGSIPNFPMSSGCTDWDWLPEYGKRGIRYSCTTWKTLRPPTPSGPTVTNYPIPYTGQNGRDYARQDVIYVYAKSPGNV
jgi:hypothetical protein